MEIRDLRYFLLVAETSSIGKAAGRAGLSQPAVTKSVQRLEAEVGAALFEKNGHRLTLTPVGALLRDRALRLVRDIESTADEVTAAAAGSTGHVRIGASMGAAEFVLPDFSAELVARFPGITLDITVGMSDALLASLKSRAVDFVIGVASAPDPEVAFHRLMDDPVVVVASARHPLAARRWPIAVADLAPYRWILPSRAARNRRWLEAVFEKAGLPPPVAQIESNDLRLMPRLISDTQLLSFMSRRNLAIEAFASRVKELPIAATTMTRRFGILTRADGYLSPATRAAIGMLKGRKAAQASRHRKPHR